MEFGIVVAETLHLLPNFNEVEAEMKYKHCLNQNAILCLFHNYR